VRRGLRRGEFGGGATQFSGGLTNFVALQWVWDRPGAAFVRPGGAAWWRIRRGAGCEMRCGPSKCALVVGFIAIAPQQFSGLACFGWCCAPTLFRIGPGGVFSSRLVACVAPWWAVLKVGYFQRVSNRVVVPQRFSNLPWWPNRGV
jgi:hypothetical protein